MSLVSLKTELRQELKLTPQLLQSMEVLQMNSQELLEYLGRVTEENPLVEQEDAPDLRTAYEELRQRASWIDGGVYSATFAHGESELPERGAVDRELESLSAFLCDQLDRKRLPKPLLALSKYLAELVDEDGYLAQEDLDGLLELKIPQTLIDQALETVQSLDPSGVGARDLSECLLLQLARQQNISPAVLDIAARFLPELGRKHYGPICRALGLTVEDVQTAEKVIAALDPHPGQAFQPAEPTVYVRPDVFIVELDGKLRAVLNEYYLPRISISGYYTKLLKESDEKDTKTYLREKLQQAKWLLNSLDRRGVTLRRCADSILAAQRPFFTGETTELAPMSLSSLADALHLHPSTISRTTRGKYLQCRQGTYPLRYFFNRAVGAQGPSRQAVKQKLLALVRSEDPRHPLSDQTLCRLLSADGTEVARRTVTKYRLELGIGSSTARKR
jgi:RNA polymerase sigma-54 factor